MISLLLFRASAPFLLLCEISVCPLNFCGDANRAGSAFGVWFLRWRTKNGASSVQRLECEPFGVEWAEAPRLVSGTLKSKHPEKYKSAMKSLISRHFLVDPKGLEPSTSRMRTERSPRLSYGPIWRYFVVFRARLADCLLSQLSYRPIRRYFVVFGACLADVLLSQTELWVHMAAFCCFWDPPALSAELQTHFWLQLTASTQRYLL